MKINVSNAIVPACISKHIEIFACPVCNSGLKLSRDKMGVQCSVCNRVFGSENGISQLFWPNDPKNFKKDVTEIIKSFYEKNPFPNYESLDSIKSLRKKAEKMPFARQVDAEIPESARVLEVGCGTGQLSNFLATRPKRTVFGADICLNSLKVAGDFRSRNELDNVGFLQMNLFKPVFKPESFDLVICNGVLHHTSNPFAGFQSISKLVKKGGYITVGLYNKFGRMPLKIRSFIFRCSNDRFKFLDPRMRHKSFSDAKKHTWFMDQYKNPHESTHTIGEVLDWFDKTGFEFINSIPKSTLLRAHSRQDIFSKNPQGTALEHLLTELGMMFSSDQDGGFFIMIGRKLP